MGQKCTSLVDVKRLWILLLRSTILDLGKLLRAPSLFLCGYIADFSRLPGDITKKEEIIRLVKEVESEEPKGIHLLVNNAGIARDDNTKYSNGAPDFKVYFLLFSDTVLYIFY
jgi:NAD(P)-dependent dehydrogenase (short-subunit alcohol dehydrogenase family)